MAHAKINISLPEGTWIKAVSERFPAVTFRVLAAMPAEDHGVGLLEIVSDDLPAVIRAIQDQDGITALDLLSSYDDEVLIQFETVEPFLLFAVRESGIPLELPVTIEGGWASIELTASQDRLSELGGKLDLFGMTYEVEYVQQSIDSESLLTPRQRELIVAAVDHGYYRTPRECTLTELAETLGVAKSTLSETLHRAEGKIISEFVEDLPSAGGLTVREQPP